jgi:tetratricopeptide (TPR) repeat protein
LTINKSTAFLKGVPMQDFNADIIRCTTAIELNPKDVSAYLARGRAHRFQGENQEAIDDYSKAIEINPVDPSLYNNRAMIYGTLLKWNKAIEDLSKVIELEPQNSSAISKREYAYTQLKNIK